MKESRSKSKEQPKMRNSSSVDDIFKLSKVKGADSSADTRNVSPLSTAVDHNKQKESKIREFIKRKMTQTFFSSTLSATSALISSLPSSFSI